MRSKKALKNIITLILQQIITIICGFIVPQLIIRTFGSNVNGLIVSITQFLAYITLLESGFGPVVKAILYKPIAKKDKNAIEKILKATEKFFRIISIIFIVYIVILCFIYPMIINNEFSTTFTVSLILILAISKFQEYFFGITYRLYLQAEQKTYVTSYIQMGTTILNTIMIVLLVLFGSNIQIVELTSAFIFVLRPILQNIYVKKKYNIKLKGITGNYKIEQKWDGFAQHIAYVIHENTDVVLLTIFSTMKEVSIYSVYLLIITGVKNIIQVFTVGTEASFGDMIAKKEKEQLNKSFKIYELFYFTIITIVFSCTIILIIPFVRVYTASITDANYIQPIFASIMVIAEFIWGIRQPYNILIKSAGHFKQTKKGAWLEAFLNIIISGILVVKFGIIGVAIGTLVAIIIRTIEFMYYSAKYILGRNLMYSFNRVIIIAIQTIIILLICNFIPMIEATSYFTWIINALIVAIISSIIIVSSNLLIYKDEKNGFLNIMKNLVKKEN